MSGLKTYLPRLAGVLGITSAALYERQRALVRLGLLSSDQGRGPGSGVKMTPDNLAALLLALAVTDNLSDTDERVGLLCEAKFESGGQCRFTKQTTLRSAVAAVLSSEELARRITSLSVDRSRLRAMIGYRARVRTMFSSFEASRELRFHFPWITTEAMVSEHLFKFVSGDLARINAQLPLRQVLGGAK